MQLFNINPDTDPRCNTIIHEAERDGAKSVEFLGRYEHPEHPGEVDWMIYLYKIESPAGYPVFAAATNGEPVWSECDACAWSELMRVYLLQFRPCSPEDVPEEHKAELDSYFGADGYSLEQVEFCRSNEDGSTDYQGDDWLLTINPQGPPSMVVGADYDLWEAGQIANAIKIQRGLED